MRNVTMTLSTSINISPAGSGSLKISDLCRLLGRSKADIWKDVRIGWLPKPIKTQKGNRWVRDDLRRATMGLPPLGMLTRLRMLEDES